MNRAAADLMPFHAMEMVARAKALEAEGRSVCHLEVGEPAAPPAPAVIEAVRAVLPEAQRYTHARGQAELRAALADHYAARHCVTVDTDNIIVTTGSSAGFLLAFLAAFEKGAAIAVTRPGYPAYFNTLVALGYRPVEIALDADSGWRLTASAIEAAHAETPFEGLIFASPANPTGAAVDREGLADVVAACRRLAVLLISDEIYHGLDYRGPSTSALEITDEAVVVNSFSKYYCMTGWRVGWMVLPPNLVRKAEILQQNLFISAPTPSQVAARVALGEPAYAEARKADYAVNRQLLDAGLRQLGFEGVRAPDGAFYAYVNVSRFTNDSMVFCRDMLDQAGIAATPGLDFDRRNGHRFVRFSYAGSRETIETALDRLGGFLATEG